MRITQRCTLISLSAIVSQNRLNRIMQWAKIDRSVRSATFLRQWVSRCGERERLLHCCFVIDIDIEGLFSVEYIHVT